MALSVTHSTVVVVADDGTSPVGTTEWNAGHTIAGLGTGVETALGLNIGSAGAPVLFNGAGGTPSSLTLTNATGLPVGGVTGLGTGVATFLATPSSANLIAAITDETGTGALVFANTPTLVTPVLGVATGTSLALGGGTALTSTNQTGTGNLVLSASPTFTGTALFANLTASGNLSVGTLVSNLTDDGSRILQASIFQARALASNKLIQARTDGTDSLFVIRNAAGWSASLTNPGSADGTLQFGTADAAAPAAQTLKFQDVIAGTSNTAGVNATIQLPGSTGNAIGGSLLIQGTAAGGSGTGKNAQATVFTLTAGGALTITGALAIANTVNSVSPTAPNRTVTMVIGGTTYYLAAKTTND